ncbi:MFS transporter [Salirhabdus salicampi]|uniref:MFS transporter n=1 Tax=Salirhabdus salicampi TaxID=476102 RepID=UPI0020C4BD20|nr:MFS transporter [Salirhabdus salicampi]MCP8615468.1 MFS transporter [Salirhabdus salicampi]
MTKFKDYHRNIKVRIAHIFFSDIIAGAIMPFLAIYFANHYGAKVAGLLLLMNVCIGMFVGLYGGYYADLVGRKKLMVIAAVIRTIAFVVMAAANSPWMTSPELTYVMTILIGASFGLDGPAAEAMLIDITKPKERKGVFSLIYWSFNLAFTLGSIGGALMFQHYLFELLIFITVSTLIATLLIVFFIEETLKVKEAPKQKHVLKHMYTSYKEVASDKVFISFVLAGMLLQSLELHLENYIAVRLYAEMPEQSFFHFTFSGVEMLGFLKAENTIIVVLLTLYITRWITKYHEGRTLLSSIVVYTIGYSVVSYSNNIWVLFIFMFFATVGELMRVPIQQEYLASIPTEDKRSAYLAVNGMLFYGAMMISSMFITLGSFLSNEMMSAFIFGSGMVAFIILFRLIPDLELRKKSASQK